MAGTTEIRAALIERLLAVPPGAAIASTAVAWEGKEHTPTPGARYYRATFLPGEPVAAGIGETAPNRHVGLFQVDIFEPANTGDALAAVEAERIAVCYKRDTALVYSGVIVRCVKSYRTRGNSDDPAWFMVSVVIQWTSDVSN